MTALAIAGTVITVVAGFVTLWAALVTRRAELSGQRTVPQRHLTLSRAEVLSISGERLRAPASEAVRSRRGMG